MLFISNMEILNFQEKPSIQKKMASNILFLQNFRTLTKTDETQKFLNVNAIL